MSAKAGDTRRQCYFLWGGVAGAHLQLPRPPNRRITTTEALSYVALGQQDMLSRLRPMIQKSSICREEGRICRANDGKEDCDRHQLQKAPKIAAARGPPAWRQPRGHAPNERGHARTESRNPAARLSSRRPPLYLHHNSEKNISEPVSLIELVRVAPESLSVGLSNPPWA